MAANKEYEDRLLKQFIIVAVFIWLSIILATRYNIINAGVNEISANVSVIYGLIIGMIYFLISNLR